MRLPALLALLKRLEWSGTGRRYDGEEVCPICRGGKPFDPDEDDGYERSWLGHTNDCELAAAIQELALFS